MADDRSVIGRLVAIIDGDISGLEKALGDAQKTLGRVGQSMTNAGKALTAGITVPIVGIGAVAAKASIDFESAFAGVRKTVDATDAQFSVLRQGIRDMAKETPASATAIAKVAEAAGQLGVKTDAILEFSKVMIDLGNTTNLTADQAATAFAQIANVMQLPQDQFDRMGAALVDLGNKGASTEADIISMAQRIAGAGATVHMSTADVLGLAAALSNVGIDAEAGGTAISRVMIEIANAVAEGSDKMAAFADVSGMTAEQFATAFKTDPANAIASFVEGLGKINSEGGNVFKTLDDLGLGEIRVRDALLRSANAGDVFRKQIEISNQAWKDNTALTNEAAKRYETTAAKLQILKNRLMDAAITLGDALVPALIAALAAAEPLIQIIIAMADGFASLPKPLQEAIILFAGLAAAMGPVLLIAGQMAMGAKSILSLITVIRLLAPAFMGALPAIEALGAALLTPPVGIIVALALLGAAIYIFRDDIKKGLVAAFEWASEAAGKAKDVIVNAFNAILDFAKNNWPEIATLLSGPFAPLVALATDGFGIRTALLDALGGLKDSAASAASDVASAIGGAFSSLGSAAGGAAGSALSAITDVINGIIDAISGLTAEKLGEALGFVLFLPLRMFRMGFEAVLPFLTTFFTQTLPTLITSTIPSLASSAMGMGSAIVRAIGDGISAGAEAVKTFFAVTLVGFITETIPSAAAAALDLGKKVVTAIGDGLQAAWDAAKSFFTQTLPGTISTAATSSYSAAIDIGRGIINGISAGVEAAWSTLQAIPGKVKDAIVTAFNGFTSFWMDIGKQIVNGIWQGIQSLGPWLMNQVKGFATGIYNAAMSAVGAHSPSRLFAQLGRFITLGLAEGIEGGIRRDVMPAMRSLMNSVTMPVSTTGFSTALPYVSGGLTSMPARLPATTGPVSISGTGGGSGSGSVSVRVDKMTINEADKRTAEQQLRDITFAMSSQLRSRGYPA